MRFFKFEDLKVKLMEMFKKAGLTDENARIVIDVIMRATLREVGHHDIYDLPSRFAGLLSGKTKPNPVFSLISKNKGLESYDGDTGLGELACMFITKRAEKLAAEHGLSICTVRNSNHFLASSPYTEAAAEDGFWAYFITRGGPSVAAPGRKEPVIGASPMGFSAPTNKGYPIMFDACVAYLSNGVLNAKIKAGETVPSHWGLDPNGNPTSDPKLIKEGTRTFIGGHKGFGIAIWAELVTGLLSDGQLIDETMPDGTEGRTSHTIICIDAGGLVGKDRLLSRAGEMIDRMTARASGLTVPGQRSAASKKKLLDAGGISLRDDLVERLNKICKQLELPEI